MMKKNGYFENITEIAEAIKPMGYEVVAFNVGHERLIGNDSLEMTIKVSLPDEKES
jgi:hypothetical protein